MDNYHIFGGQRFVTESDHAAALAQIEGLERDKSSLIHRCNLYAEDNAKMLDMLNSAQSDLAAAKRDAARYQWLRVRSTVTDIQNLHLMGGNLDCEPYDIEIDRAIDRAIDAARTPSAAQGGEKP